MCWSRQFSYKYHLTNNNLVRYWFWFWRHACFYMAIIEVIYSIKRLLLVFSSLFPLFLSYLIYFRLCFTLSFLIFLCAVSFSRLISFSLKVFFSLLLLHFLVCSWHYWLSWHERTSSTKIGHSHFYNSVRQKENSFLTGLKNECKRIIHNCEIDKSLSVSIAFYFFILFWTYAKELIIQTLATVMFLLSTLMKPRFYFIIIIFFILLYFEPTHSMVILLICCTQPIFCFFFPPLFISAEPYLMFEGWHTLYIVYIGHHNCDADIFPWSNLPIVYLFILFMAIENCDLIFWYSATRCYGIWLLSLLDRYFFFVV